MFFRSTIHDEALSNHDAERSVAMLETSELVIDNTLDHFTFGLACFEAKDYAQAAAALRLVPPDPPARFAWAQEWLGQAYLRLHRDQLAVETLQRALRLHEFLNRDPLTIAECQYSLGLAFARSGHEEMALAQFRQVLRHAPDWSSIHFEEARVHARRNRIPDCLNSLAIAARQDRHFLEKASRDPDFAQVLQTPQFLRLHDELVSTVND